ncbi:MAG: carbohydrate porin [bacterium]
MKNMISQFHRFVLLSVLFLVTAQIHAWGAHEGGKSRVSYLEGFENALAYGLTKNIDAAGVCLFTSRDGNNDTRGGECTFNTHLVLNVDFTKAGPDWSGNLNFDVESRQGPGITSRRLGDIFGVNNDEGRNFTQISELLYQRDYPSSSYFKIGQMDAGADFQVVENAGEFLNSAFGVIPNLPVPTFPDYAFGAVVSRWLPEFGYARLGVTDGAMADGTSKTETAFDQTFYALEIGYVPTVPVEDEPHAVYKVGMFKHTGNISDCCDGLEHNDNHGFYFVADQPLSHKAGLFLQFGDTPDDRSFISRYWGAGVAFNGFLKSRPEDAAGVALGTGRINSYSRERGAGSGESVLEVYYKFQTQHSLSLMPDFQWIRSPGGNGKNNLIYGLKFQYSY